MFTLFGVPVANINLAETLRRIQGFLADGKQHLVVTANPEIMLEARRNPEYRKVLQDASLVVADGFGLVLASYVLGSPLTKGRVTGVDLVKALVNQSGAAAYSVFLAGSTQEILDKTTLNLSSNYSNINILGTYSGIKSTNELGILDPIKESAELISRLVQAKPDILLLAYGHPRQELWLSQHLAGLPVKVAIGVGGSFDYLSDQVSRAPQAFRSIGLEWLWRLFAEPRRIKRIFNATVVFPLVIKLELVKKLFHVEQK